LVVTFSLCITTATTTTTTTTTVTSTNTATCNERMRVNVVENWITARSRKRDFTRHDHVTLKTKSDLSNRQERMEGNTWSLRALFRSINRTMTMPMMCLQGQIPLPVPLRRLSVVLPSSESLVCRLIVIESSTDYDHDSCHEHCRPS
jgi:hypothetical protein